MQLLFSLRRSAAILVPSLLLAGLAPHEAMAREEANVIPVVQLATTAVELAPAIIRGNLLLASDGNIYAISSDGGNRGGAIARIAPDGTMTVLFAPDKGEQGASAYAGLMQATDGHLYGTTYLGGEKGLGVVFRLTLDGVYTVLRSLGQTKVDAALPYAGLVQAGDGNLYGTTLRGGVNDKGTLFRINLGGDNYQLLYSFDGSNGENPEGTLIVGSDGNLYGTTLGGGSGRGTIFRATTAGAVTSLYSFPSLSAFSTSGLAINATGANPRAGLLLAADGNYYGTAYQGGPNGYGTLFKMTPAGAVSVVHAFAGPLSGAGFPLSSVTQDAAGNLYGTTEQGGSINQGAAWRYSASGQFGLLHSFIGSPIDGNKPYASLIEVGNFLYGVTSSDVTSSAGAIFKLDQGTGGVLPIELSLAPNDITVGGSTTLTWSSPGAASCTTDGAWTGTTVGTSGTQSVTPALAGIYTYILTCTDGAGVARNAYAAVAVRAPPQESVDGSGGGGALSIPALLLLGALALRKKQ
jgi:uncharacterized repeat protein (TIGR03803 family)